MTFLPVNPGFGMGKKSRSGAGIRDEHPGSYFPELRNYFLVKNTQILGCGSGSGIFFNPGSKMEVFGSGILDKHTGSATLIKRRKKGGDLVCEGTLEVFLLSVEQQAAIAAVEESAHPWRE